MLQMNGLCKKTRIDFALPSFDFAFTCFDSGWPGHGLAMEGGWQRKATEVAGFVGLEPLKKFWSHPVRPSGSGLFSFWRRFRSVWLPKPCESGAQSRRALRAKQSGHCGHAPSLKRGLPKPCQSVSPSKDVPLRGKQCQKPKILAPFGYRIS